MRIQDTTIPAPPPEHDDGTIDAFMLEAGFRRNVLQHGGSRAANAETAMILIGAGLVLDTWASALPERQSRWRSGVRRHKFLLRRRSCGLRRAA